MRGRCPADEEDDHQKTNKEGEQNRASEEDGEGTEAARQCFVPIEPTIAAGVRGRIVGKVLRKGLNSVYLPCR